MYTTLPGIKNLKISHTGLDKVTKNFSKMY